MNKYTIIYYYLYIKILFTYIDKKITNLIIKHNILMYEIIVYKLYYHEI